VIRINISDSRQMRRITNLFTLLFTASVLLVACDNAQPPAQSAPVPVVNKDGPRYVADISVHSVADMRSILNRADRLVNMPRASDQPANIALILHGPEIDFFNIDNYHRYRSLVDQAARLDAYNVIDIRMCETMMKERGLSKSKVPGFIDFVPDGEVEVKKLKQDGYAIL